MAFFLNICYNMYMVVNGKKIERIFLSPPFLDGAEKKYVDAAFASNYIAPCGPWVNRFEADIVSFTKVPYACALSSATAGLDLIWDYLQIRRGDAIFCSDLTFVASIAPAIHRGAIPTFIGVNDTLTMDPNLLEDALKDAAKRGTLPKAVIAVDLYGESCDYATIAPICAQYSVPLISDAAESLGSSYRDQYGNWRKTGDAGIASVYSFNGNKIITSSGGGMLISHDADLIKSAHFLSQQAKDPYPWYEHTRLGYNYRMSNISAAIGVGQLEHLDAKVAKKREIFATYQSYLQEDFTFQREAEYSHSNRWLTVAISRNATFSPETLRQRLEAENVESRHLWKPMHLQPVFKDAPIYGKETTELPFSRGICLPSWLGLTDELIASISKIVTETK